MKKLIILPLVLLFTLTACNEQQKIEAIRAGQETATFIAASVRGAVELLHAAGKISDENYAKFGKLYATYEAANKTLTDGLVAWEAGVDKPPIARLLEFLKRVNTIVADINDLIAVWKTAYDFAGWHIYSYKEPLLGTQFRSRVETFNSLLDELR